MKRIYYQLRSSRNNEDVIREITSTKEGLVKIAKKWLTEICYGVRAMRYEFISDYVLIIHYSNDGQLEEKMFYYWKVKVVG